MIHQFEPLWGVWNVEKLLGSGSFGKVWQVSCSTPEGTKYAAVKEVKISYTDEELEQVAYAEGFTLEGIKEYFNSVLHEMLEEVKLMKHLSYCSQVVQIYDSELIPIKQQGKFGWVLLIRIEKLTPFRKRQLEGNMSVVDVAKLGIDISQALEACLQLGIIHRDIKPDNLFYCPENDSYKLGDFGFSRYLDRPTAGKGKAGTLTHMTPEVHRGELFTPASDLYALGIILYRMLNDNRIPLLPPFPENFTLTDRDTALVRRLNGEEPGAPSIVRYASNKSCLNHGIGAHFDESTRDAAISFGTAVQKAVSADPKARFASPTEFREAIEDAFPALLNRNR